MSQPIDPSASEPLTRPRAGQLAGWGSLAAVLVLCAWVGRRLWFFSDDWNILADYHDGGLLEPFNGHLSLVPAGLYRLAFAVFGTGSYLPYRLIGLAGLAVLGVQVLRYASERLAWSGRSAWLAALVLSAVMWNPAGATNLMFPFLVNFSLPIAALVAVWRHLDRARPGDDVAASVWLAVALGSSGLGVVALAAVLVELAVGRAPLRRWVVLAPAPLLWGLWFVTHAGANEWSRDPGAVLSYSARMLLGATTSLAAGWTPGGVVLAGGLVALVVVAACRWRSLDARALGSLAAPLGFVVSTSLTRLDIVPAIPPDELRYSWTVAAYLVLFAVAVWRPDRALTSRVWLPPALGALATLAVVAGAARLVSDVRGWTAMVADARPRLEAVLLATELLGADRLGAERVLPLSYVPVTVGGYLDATSAVGSPVADLEPTAGPSGTAADELLVAAADVSAAADPLPTACSPLDPATPVAAGTTLLLVPGAGTQSGDAAGVPALSRFGTEPVPLRIDGAAPVLVELAPDLDAGRGAALPYRIQVPPGWSVQQCT